MPGIREHLFLSGLGLAAVFLLRPMWVGGFVFGCAVILLSRLLFSSLARFWPSLLGLWALGKQLGLAGLAIAGILLGLHPLGVALGLSLWPVSLWIWAVRHVRHSR